MTAAATTAEQRALTCTIAAADRLRARWLRLLGGLARPFLRDRELRIAAAFSALIVTTTLATILAPLWLLLLGPLVWGVPHLVADLRYLVLRPGQHRRPYLPWLAGGPLLWISFGGDAVWGFVGAAAVALVARASRRARALACLLLAALAAVMLALGPVGDLLFAHLHNFLAIPIWWAWRRRSGRAHLVPLALLSFAGLFLLTDTAAALASSGLRRSGAGMDANFQLWRLAPDVAPALGLRLVLLFCFLQSLHYAVWMHLLPDEDRPRATPPPYRARVAALRRDLGDTGLAIAALLALGVALWAVFDLAQANRGYFRMARFHGHLEVMALTLLLLERRAR